MSYEIDKFLEMCNALPEYCFDFFAAKSETLSLKTRMSYALDLKVFFEYLISAMPDIFPYDDITSVALNDLENLSSTDIDKYLMYLTEYESNGVIYKNSAEGKKRKLSTLKTFFKYFARIGKLKTNPAEWVETPKIREKEIVLLSSAEQEKLYEAMEQGIYHSKRAVSAHEKVKYRNLAILSMFLGTGLRVSELIGIDEYDLDLNEQRVLVTRKGGKREFIYFNDDVLNDILTYMDYERRDLLGIKDEEDEKAWENAPLFVSLKRRRLSVRMVQTIIREYSQAVLPRNMKVTPHTLRKTFGTENYAKYRDLYLTQQALGHTSPSTTARYYAKFDPEYLKILKDK